MDLEERLKKIDEFFSNLSLEEFERISIEAGLGKIEETPRLDLDDDTINIIRNRKNNPVEYFRTGYIFNFFTNKNINTALKNPRCGIIICKGDIPIPILQLLHFLRIEVYHNVSDEELNSRFIKKREVYNNESTGDDGDI